MFTTRQFTITVTYFLQQEKLCSKGLSHSVKIEFSQEEVYELIMRKEEQIKDLDLLSTQPRKKRGQ